MASTHEHIDSTIPTHPTLVSATHESYISPPQATANISIREYIYFLPYPLPPGTPVPYSIGLPDTNPLNLPSHQFEPTSTLVLTSPMSNFVDIRLFKPFEDDHVNELPNQGERKRLEWAFAGTSESHPIDSTINTTASPRKSKRRQPLPDNAFKNGPIGSTPAIPSVARRSL